jgi:hypothetical protein
MWRTPPRGARLACGGKRLHARARCSMRRRFSPTFPTDAAILREETFGPVAADRAVRPEDEVLARANDSERAGGLPPHPATRAASTRLSRALQFGMVAVNRTKVTGAPVPFGGVKQSGLGREGSRLGMEEFTESNTSAATGHEGTGAHQTRDDHGDQRPTRRSGIGRISSIPRPISPSTRAAKRRAGSSPAARASGSRTATATGCSMPSPASIASMSAMAAGDRRSDRRPGEGTRLLPRLCRPRHRSLDHACEDDPRPRAGQHVEGVFRPGRVGCQRDQRQAGLVLQQHPRPAREEEDHLALARLSRLGSDDRLADRARSSSTKFDLPLAQVLHTEAPYYFRRPDADMSEAEFVAIAPPNWKR